VGGGTPELVSRPGAAHPTPSPDGRFLYLARQGPEHARVWRMPTGGGEEELVLEFVNNNTTWDLHGHTLYYLAPAEPDGKASLVRRDLLTSESQKLARVEGPIREGLTVTPDGRLAFYARAGAPSADLVMIEGW